MNQTQADQMAMAMADVVSRQSTCNRAKVGCVIMKDTRCISQGYNGSPMGKPHCPEHEEVGCTRTIHAEINAILFAARMGISTDGATLCTTLSPCVQCSMAIINSGISRVLYRDLYRIRDGIDYLQDSHVKVERLHVPISSPFPASVRVF